METPRITLRQAFWLFVISRFILALVFSPIFAELPNNQDILISYIFGIPMQLLYMLVIAMLMSKYPNQTLIEYSYSILGRWLGKGVGILYIGYFVLHASITLRIFIEFLTTRFFVNTPVEVISLGILLIATYGVYMGLEVLGRCADVLVPLIILGTLLLVVLAIPEAHLQNVIPTWETGMVPMVLGNIPTTTRWSELAWIAMILPYIAGKQNIKRVFLGGVLLVNALWITLAFAIVAVFGPDTARTLNFPTLELVQIISIGNFLERIDAFVLGLWVFGSFLKISIFYYVAVLGAAQWFGLKDKKPLISPMGLILFILSLLLFSNIVELRNFGKTIVPVDFIFVFVIPLVMLIVHFVKKKALFGQDPPPSEQPSSNR
jgi:spore germination protein KB